MKDFGCKIVSEIVQPKENMIHVCDVSWFDKKTNDIKIAVRELKTSKPGKFYCMANASELNKILWSKHPKTSTVQKPCNVIKLFDITTFLKRNLAFFLS